MNCVERRWLCFVPLLVLKQWLRSYCPSTSNGTKLALGIPLLSGRDFTDADRNGAERVVIINARVANQLFPGQRQLRS